MRTRLLLIAGVAAALLVSCQPTTRASGAATTWRVISPTIDGAEIVGNPTTPAAYGCSPGVDYGVENGLILPGDCQAHFTGTGFAIEVPRPFLVALWGSYSTRAMVGPLAVEIRNDATGTLLLRVPDMWNGANPPSTPRYPRSWPTNLYFATAGAGTLTSGYRNYSGSAIPVDDIRVAKVPRVVDVAHHRVRITCSVESGSKLVRKDFYGFS